ncbi:MULTISPECIES: PAS domain-containing sensor histidine kinase [unclassified Nocardioides]|uniref:PAS domain-containing sensor histidine kinase n=1 Tax=unclassified Nocardioides TaxID=2615069 RepID=UPI001885BA8B|nr:MULTISPECIES: ATP-binding protein [unclassified Nocardioides]
MGGEESDGLRAEAEQLRRAERVLAETSERFRSLFDYHPHAVFSVDLNGRFDSVNPAAARLSGRAVGDLLGRRFAELLAPAHLVPVLVHFQRALDRESVQFETVLRRPDGELVELAISALPIVVDDVVEGVYGIAEDITARNRLQRELDGTRRSAEQANRAKSLFLANISHEIRTPLTSVLASAELLAETPLEPDQRMLVGSLARNGERLRSLVDDLLDFSRIEAGALLLDRRPMDLRAVVAGSVERVRAAAEATRLGITVRIDEELPAALVGDPERVAQVLANLLGNAVKFTHRGGVAVDVEVAERTTEVVKVLVRVSDSGIGIASEEQDRLFETFSQADPTITRQYGGTGLGLAVCRQLLTLMGGAIWVQSAPGEGSTFSFVLPLGLPR